MQKGCVHIYTGDGKGKTSAATGLAVRAAGRGLRVGFFQFMKGGASGEQVSLQKLGVVVVSPKASKKFVWDMDETEKAAYASIQQQTLDEALVRAAEFDLMVLDEVISCMATGMVDKKQVTAFIASRPQGLELVMTGRDAGEELVALSDYVSEIKMVKHPFAFGVPARRGIEF